VQILPGYALFHISWVGLSWIRILVRFASKIPIYVTGTTKSVAHLKQRTYIVRPIKRARRIMDSFQCEPWFKMWHLASEPGKNSLWTCVWKCFTDTRAPTTSILCCVVICNAVLWWYFLQQWAVWNGYVVSMLSGLQYPKWPARAVTVWRSDSLIDYNKGKGKGKGKVVPVIFFSWAPRHEGVLEEWRYISTHYWPRH
jgi:hypothetical protein